MDNSRWPNTRGHRAVGGEMEDHNNHGRTKWRTSWETETWKKLWAEDRWICRMGMGNGPQLLNPLYLWLVHMTSNKALQASVRGTFTLEIVVTDLDPVTWRYLSSYLTKVAGLINKLNK